MLVRRTTTDFDSVVFLDIVFLLVLRANSFQLYFNKCAIVEPNHREALALGLGCIR